MKVREANFLGGLFDVETAFEAWYLATNHKPYEKSFFAKPLGRKAA